MEDLQDLDVNDWQAIYGGLVYRAPVYLHNGTKLVPEYYKRSFLRYLSYIFTLENNVITIFGNQQLIGKVENGQILPFLQMASRSDCSAL